VSALCVGELLACVISRGRYNGRVMPSPGSLLLFAVASTVLIAIPGPAVIFIATRSLGHGRRIGIVSALGIETGTMVHVTLAALGLSALIRSSQTAFDVVRYAGAAYLVLLGLRTMLRRKGGGDGVRSRPVATARRAFGEGVVVNVLNPKIALFFLAFLPQFIDPARGSATLQVLALGLLFVAIATVLDCTWALAAGGVGSLLRRRQAIVRRGHLLSGGVYLALGALAALTGPHARKT
jgi:threonine/homoserine/homoserine lactone efflux protein